MDSLFSVDEDINFSDDEDELLNMNLPDRQYGNASISNNEILLDSDQFKMKQSYGCRQKKKLNFTWTNRYGFTGSEQACDKDNPTAINASKSKSSFIGDKQDFCFENFFDDDDDDDLLSHIDFPLSENNSSEVPERHEADADEVILNITHAPSRAKSINSESFRVDRSTNVCSTSLILRQQPSEILYSSKTLQEYNALSVTDNATPSAIPRNNLSVKKNRASIPPTTARNKLSFNKEKNNTMLTQCEKNSVALVDSIHFLKRDKDMCVNKSQKRKNFHSLDQNPSILTPARQRKFPGPAGLLPKINNVKELNAFKSPEISKDKRTLTPATPKTHLQTMMCLSQDDDFIQKVWKDVKAEISQLFPQTDMEIISSILQKATSNQLDNGKVPLLCGLIKSFSINGSSGKLILKDPSGEINGTVHRHVLEEFEADFKHGTGLILKDVSVFSPTMKKHYINITPANIVQLIPSDNNETLSYSQLSQTPQTKVGKENISEQSTRTPDIENRLNNPSCKDQNIDTNQLSVQGVAHNSNGIFESEEVLDDFFSDEMCFF